LSGVAAIACGREYSLALCSNGVLVAWGDNTYGQTNVPAGLTNATYFSAGGEHGLWFQTNLPVAAWGNNLFGQASPPPLTNVLAMTGGGYHSLIIVPVTVPTNLTFDITPPNLHFTPAGFQLQVDGPNGSGPVVIYSSTDLQTWQPVFTNPPTTSPVQFSDPNTNPPAKFYRAREN